VVVAGPWGILDARGGLPTEKMLDDVGALEALGVEWVISLVCGDDLGASLDTIDALGADVVAPAR
jgi:hypothetical protein